MCLASKYPEAIPLKKVDAPTVAEAMLEIFSRIGVPSEILTDQDGFCWQTDFPVVWKVRGRPD